MVTVHAHVLGVPLEETAAAVLPIGFALVVAVRASGERARHALRRTARRATGERP